MTIPMTSLADTMAAGIAQHASAQRAVQERHYLKSSLVHWGVATPALRQVVTATLRGHPELDRRSLLGLVEALWQRGIHELRAAALLALERKINLLEADDIRIVERWLRESRNWAYVDFLAARVAGRLCERFTKLDRTLDRWAGDPDFWVRRAALLALLPPLRRGSGDFERFSRFADTMLGERERFIRKAIGWVLREVAKRRPKLVVDWLEPRLGRVSGLTLREATRHLPAGLAAALLVAHQTAGTSKARRSR